ncbi:hypothetical protein IT072_03835 [Leifsonia sp. ZF2019]|uniref:hypothetical protein n=1 Tax=Leifsonia sp. ZF2019 TaxID=2781978 RepID=UPI001CBAA156|nr:hypothetical protein [Leifsonia sp. ZF2019]UAJ80189.1 hypothetical protein IT072_03835 [Leifsonia sp. ZF2019]
MKRALRRMVAFVLRHQKGAFVALFLILAAVAFLGAALNTTPLLMAGASGTILTYAAACYLTGPDTFGR